MGAGTWGLGFTPKNLGFMETIHGSWDTASGVQAKNGLMGADTQDLGFTKKIPGGDTWDLGVSWMLGWGCGVGRRGRWKGS